MSTVKRSFKLYQNEHDQFSEGHVEKGKKPLLWGPQLKIYPNPCCTDPTYLSSILSSNLKILKAFPRKRSPLKAQEEIKKIRQGKGIKREGEEWKTESQDCGVRETQTAD